MNITSAIPFLVDFLKRERLLLRPATKAGEYILATPEGRDFMAVTAVDLAFAFICISTGRNFQ